MGKTFFYRQFSEDIVGNKHQNYRIPEDYIWVHENRGYRFLSSLFYGAAKFLGLIYCRVFLHASVEDRRECRDGSCGGSPVYGSRAQPIGEGRRGRQEDSGEGCFMYGNHMQPIGEGYYLYGNHTQPIGDVFLPALICGRRRCFTIASQANLGLGVLGKILPMLGALPVPDGFAQMRKFWDAVARRVGEGNCVAIYPEAHVWPYYTGIRPFPVTAFRFPVENRAPAFAMTVTYQKRRWGRKPRATVYVDGPFWPDGTLNRKGQQEKLCEEVRACMEGRSRHSTFEYVHYRCLSHGLCEKNI